MEQKLSDAQQALVVKNAHVVTHATRLAIKKYGRLLGTGDIIQTAQMALIQAALSYREGDGTFPGYAWARVRGAITDLAGKETSVKRLERSLLDYMTTITRKGSILTDTSGGAKAEAVEQTQAAIVAAMLGMLAETATAEDILIRREAVGAVRDAVAGLNAMHRRVVEEVHLGEQRLTDTAEKLGWTMITTRRRRQAALEELAKSLSHLAPEHQEDKP